jgi:hypothetical protein
LSHVQPSFDALVSAAKEALDMLFSEADLLRYTQSRHPPLLTQDQLLNAQTVGYVQYKLCFSCHLMSDKQRQLVRSFRSVALNKFFWPLTRSPSSIMRSHGGRLRTKGPNSSDDPRRSSYGTTCLWMSYRWHRRSLTMPWRHVGSIPQCMLSPPGLYVPEIAFQIAFLHMKPYHHHFPTFVSHLH